MRVQKQGRIGRLGWVVLMLIGIMLIVLLYSIKTRALEARALLRHLEHQKVQDRAAVRMLSAEIAHMQSPERLRKLAAEHLGFEPLSAEQVMGMKDAVGHMPLKDAAGRGQ